MAVLIFDYDGTLHDSMKIYEPAVRFCHNKFVAEGIVKDRPVSREEILRYLGLTASEMWESFAPELSEEQKRQGSRIVGEKLRELIGQGKAALYDGAEEVLKKLKEEGHRLVFLSNCSEGYRDANRKAFGLDRFFSEMYCSEQFDWIPKPQIVRQLLPGWEGPVIAIGDRYKDMEIASVGGIGTIWCSYGFAMPWEGNSADAIAHRVTEIPDRVSDLLKA